MFATKGIKSEHLESEGWKGTQTVHPFDLFEIKNLLHSAPSRMPHDEHMKPYHGSDTRGAMSVLVVGWEWMAYDPICLNQRRAIILNDGVGNMCFHPANLRPTFRVANMGIRRAVEYPKRAQKRVSDREGRLEQYSLNTNNYKAVVPG